MSADPNRLDYPQLQYLRQVLAPDYAILPAAQIRSRMEAVYGEGSADAYNDYLASNLGEFSFSDIGKFVAKVAPAVATVGGGALQGALSGAQFGLPGIIAGAAAGGAGAGLSKYGSGTARDIGGALTGVTGLASQFSPLGRVGAAVGPAISGLAGGGSGGLPGAAANVLSGVIGALGSGGGAAGAVSSLLGRGGAGGAGAGAAGALSSLFGGGSAAGQLLSLLQRPEFTQALGALNLGAMGRKTIPVGSQQVPVPAASIARVAAELADQISTEAAGWSSDAESDLSYMMNQEGEYVGDPALDRDRAARVWNLLNEAQAERILESLVAGASIPTESIESFADYSGDAIDADQEYYDAMDLAETYALSNEAEAYTGYTESDYER